MKSTRSTSRSSAATFFTPSANAFSRARRWSSRRLINMVRWFPSCSRPTGLLGVEEVNHLRDRPIHLPWNHPVHLHTVVHGPCQSLVFHDPNLMLLGNLPNLQRDHILAFADHDRCAALFAHTAQRY